MKGAFEDFLPAHHGYSVASVYAEFAHRQGWLAADRVLGANEYASMRDVIDSWAAHDRVWAEVTSAFGPPVGADRRHQPLLREDARLPCRGRIRPHGVLSPLEQHRPGHRAILATGP